MFRYNPEELTSQGFVLLKQCKFMNTSSQIRPQQISCPFIYCSVVILPPDASESVILYYWTATLGK